MRKLACSGVSSPGRDTICRSASRRATPMRPRMGASGPPIRTQPAHLLEGAKQAPLFGAAALPSAAGRDRHRRQGAPSPGQLDGEPAAERVAGDVHAIDARGVELGLGHVDRSRDAVPESGRDGLAAHVAGKRGDEHLVSPLERRQDGTPGFGAESERVQEKERLPRATVMSDGGAQDHSDAFRGKDIIPTIELRGSSDQRRVALPAPRGRAPFAQDARSDRGPSASLAASARRFALRTPASCATFCRDDFRARPRPRPAGRWRLVERRPPECSAEIGGATANVWERAKSPELRRYCDLVASAASKLAGTRRWPQAALAAAREADERAARPCGAARARRAGARGPGQARRGARGAARWQGARSRRRSTIRSRCSPGRASLPARATRAKRWRPTARSCRAPRRSRPSSGRRPPSRRVS